MNLDSFISKLDGLESKVEFVYNETIETEAPEANREQLLKGINADGDNITKQIVRAGATTYSNGYAKRRRSKGLQTKHIDARFSGKYHKSIKADKKGKNFELDAKDPKADRVEKNLGNLVGLNDQAVVEVEKTLEIELNKLLIKELA